MSNTRKIYGFHAVTSRIRKNPNSIKEIFHDSTRHDKRIRDLKKLAENKNIRLISCDEDRLVTMSGSTRHQGVAALIDTNCSNINIEDVLESLKEPALFLVLDGVKDPHNLGACFRVADAFGVHAIIAPKNRAVGLTAAVHKIASGAVDTIPYISVTNLARALRELKHHGVWIIGATVETNDELQFAKIDGPVAWVLGAEGEGMRRLTRETCDQLISIPMLGSVECLNVSVSAGICLFETFRQRKSRKL